jgi:DNA-binding transcriptional MerR regulator
MAIQQLDLFASFQQEPPVKEELPAVEVIAAEAPQPVIETAEPVLEITPAALAPAKEVMVPPSPAPAAEVSREEHKPIVFADENISVRIRPKVHVQQPEPRQVITTAKPKSKRGRKSYKEIDAELDLIEIPEDEVLNQKLYYSITEVAKWFRVNASLLRYWENEFDILKPRKNRKGDRLFRPEDIKNLQVIYYLLRNRKFSLEGAKKYLRNNRQQADVNVQLAQSLTKFRSFLLELKANLGA